MKRPFFYLLILIVSGGLIYEILSIWKGLYLFNKNPSKEVLLEAIRLEPLNPDPFYKLGLFYQWDIEAVDLEKSVHYLSKAIERNPLEQAYWLNLAKVFQRRGDQRAFEQSLKMAVRVFPIGYQGRWVIGNLFLQQGDLEKAIPHFSYILAHYPDKSNLVYDVWSNLVNDSDLILEKLVPKGPESLSQYLYYLYGIGDRESVKKVWRRMLSLGYKADRREALRYIEFLISHGEPNEAREVWNDRLKEEGFSFPFDGNLIINGSFEMEKILGGGFDWKIEEMKGVKVSFDTKVAFEGKRSLKIIFNGKENIDFSHISQLVALKPNTEYLLKAHMRTEAVTTKSGLKMEIIGASPAFYAASESLVGDNEWKELSVRFRTPAQSKSGWVRFRREKTDKFDRYISGTVWIDDVQLREASH